jgi:Nucleotidyl transferase
VKPSLLVMAAGLGSRYGGLKQMEPMGPNGAALLDYTVYDALLAGFGKVVFVIRRDIEADFKKIIGKKWERRVPVRYVYQELSMVPEGFGVPPGREKPWGTAHAVWVAQGAVREPFAVANADDFYGRGSLRALADFLKKLRSVSAPDYAMVGFPLGGTLSEEGQVARGLCRIGKGRMLKEVVERVRIGRAGRKIFYHEGERRHPVPASAVASMNLWGFTPLIFRQLDRRWGAFLREKGGEPKSEFLIPRVVDDVIASGQARVKVLSTKDRWFGVTYPGDRDRVRAAVERMVRRKAYPEVPWA